MIALIGATGQLGGDLADGARRRGLDLRTFDHAELEIADPRSVERALSSPGPRVVINTAARHGAASSRPADQDALFRDNALGPWHLARWCAREGALLMHYSTDYVFGGGAAGHAFTEQDVPLPLNAYGASKLAGEHLIRAACPRHYIVRVASLYGARGCRAKGGTNFVKNVLERARSGGPLSIVNDQTMSPSCTRAVSDKSFELLLSGAPSGVYHMAGSGACTWYELASEVVRLAGLTAEVRPTVTEPEPPGSLFVRPRFTALDNAALRAAGLSDLPSWRETLAAFVREEIGVRAMEPQHERA